MQPITTQTSFRSLALPAEPQLGRCCQDSAYQKCPTLPYWQFRYMPQISIMRKLMISNQRTSTLLVLRADPSHHLQPPRMGRSSSFEDGGRGLFDMVHHHQSLKKQNPVHIQVYLVWRCPIAFITPNLQSASRMNLVKY